MPLPDDALPIDETQVFRPRFGADGLMPAVVVETDTGAVLMLAYVNEAALALTLERGEAHYWSRSRQQIWHKGATSGAVQEIVSVRTDCDQDALLYEVRQRGGGACHTGRQSCFYRVIEKTGDADNLTGGSKLTFTDGA